MNHLEGHGFAILQNQNPGPHFLTMSKQLLKICRALVTPFSTFT